jgi:hypothetical protein
MKRFHKKISFSPLLMPLPFKGSRAALEKRLSFFLSIGRPFLDHFTSTRLASSSNGSGRYRFCAWLLQRRDMENFFDSQ